MSNNVVEVKVIPVEIVADIDFDAVLYDLDKHIDLLSSQADKWDCLVAVASGILCGMLDILWVGDFSLESGRTLADDKAESFVKKATNLLGYKGDDLQSAVRYLEKLFPIPSDGNTPDFGGGLQHHLRDFAHHPTLVGLLFSLLTQFTKMSYGTDVDGTFKIVPISERSKKFIGEDVPDKLFKGTIIWFFHLVSDMAGSSGTAGNKRGTGIPGPILSLAKELSALPVFKDMKIGDNKLSVFLSKVFNGTLFAKHDENGKIIKETVVNFDLRSELGVIAELGKQALPVIANDCIVRCFYFIRGLAFELKSIKYEPVKDNGLKSVDWDKVKPFGNPTIMRMLTISSAVFSTVDIAEAVVSKKYFVAVNYAGVGRFAVAVGTEIMNYIKVRDVKLIKQMYEDLKRNTFTSTDGKIYGRIGEGMDIGNMAITIDQTEILYNLEMLKTQHDIDRSNLKKELKEEWLKEWKYYMEIGFPSFAGDENAVLHWYSVDELRKKIYLNYPEKTWFRLVILEAMLFEPYYPLSLEIDKNGKEVPSTKYKELNLPVIGYSKSEGDKFLDNFFTEDIYTKGYISRLRKCYDKVLRELN